MQIEILFVSYKFHCEAGLLSGFGFVWVKTQTAPPKRGCLEITEELNLTECRQFQLY